MKRNSYIGLDIGHHNLKAVQIDRSAQGWRITNSASLATPKGAVRDGHVSDPQTVAAAIKVMLSQAGMNGKNAVLAVQSGSVVVRTVRVPKMTEAVLRKSIKYEAGRYIPNSVDESYIEFEILGQADDSQMDVLIVAAPNELVNSRLQTAALAGLEVDIVDLGPFAAYRSLLEFNNTRPWATETVALIDLGANTTTVSVIKNGVFSIVRTVSSGSANFTDALKTFFDLSDEDAESGKCQLNVAELVDDKPMENPPLRVLHPYVDELAREIRRSINYFESQQTAGDGHEPVKTVVLTGGGAKLQGLDAYLAAKLSLDVICLGALDNPNLLNNSNTDLDRGLEYGIAAGLAMRPLIKAA